MQCPAGTLIGIEALIDALVADAGLVIGLEVAGDLFGTPSLREFAIDDGPDLIGNAATVVRGPHAGF